MLENRVLANACIATCFLLGAIGACGFVVVFWWTDDQLLEGVFFGSGLIAIALGLVVWSYSMMPQGPFEEEYPDLPSSPEEEAEVLARADRGEIGRRKLLIGSLGLAGGAITAVVGSSVRSLGPGPFSLAGTPWRPGRRAVTPDGRVVQTRDMPINSMLVVLPQGFEDNPMAQAVLVRLPPGANHPLPGRSRWAPDGFICYSRVCSHAGCPVSLYNALKYELQCPCHQSTFDVLHGAQPVFGPAGGPLPQLPIAIQNDGTLRSTGDFSAPPGPVFWHNS